MGGPAGADGETKKPTLHQNSLLHLSRAQGRRRVQRRVGLVVLELVVVGRLRLRRRRGVVLAAGGGGRRPRGQGRQARRRLWARRQRQARPRAEEEGRRRAEAGEEAQPERLREGAKARQAQRWGRWWCPRDGLIPGVGGGGRKVGSGTVRGSDCLSLPLVENTRY